MCKTNPAFWNLILLLSSLVCVRCPDCGPHALVSLPELATVMVGLKNSYKSCMSYRNVYVLPVYIPPYLMMLYNHSTKWGCCCIVCALLDYVYTASRWSKHINKTHSCLLCQCILVSIIIITILIICWNFQASCLTQIIFCGFSCTVQITRKLVCQQICQNSAPLFVPPWPTSWTLVDV